jgi:glyoxylase-like metal-dependent hydrolase (beta-lactamase superfamily II)
MLHTLRLALPNVYLVTGDKAVLVDTGGPGDVPRILDFLRLHNALEKLSLILVTHAHWDHAGGAAELRAATKAPVALHRGDFDMARTGSNGSARPTGFMGYLIRAFVNRGYPPIEPDVAIDDEIDLSPFGVAARVIPTPGHTKGSISVLTADGDAVIGDLLMGGILGGKWFPAWPGMHYFADDLAQLHASIRKVVALAPKRIHVGHGGPLDPKDVARWCAKKRIAI